MLSYAHKIRSGIYLASCLAFSANAIDAPVCPKAITVKNGEIERVETWEVAYASYFLTLKDKRVDGVFSTDSKAPTIGLQHSLDDVAGLGADNIDEFMEEREIYPNRYWTYNEDFAANMFFCAKQIMGGICYTNLLPINFQNAPRLNQTKKIQIGKMHN